ncbi:MAG: hypothetical protein EBZ69_09195 [Alphaproteobacteria bacterium]|nr:hypothetical protein [Alphaproteobacteria bacterium]NDC56958.1 hypothetical protein [Alphaproteobacteria bacterium]NDG05439.1 hypothetical protein [Alphaproteobacteria bacterium]
MADDLLQYDVLVERALRSVVRDALQQVAKNNLPDKHHFYISFHTKFNGVDIPDYLHKQYPQEMTIVLQHQFFGLKVHDDYFGVTLSFNGRQERLTIPFQAITSFADPHANFALQFQTVFEPSDTPPEGNDDENNETPPSNDEPDAPKQEKRGEVISLDKFRKKK